MKKSPPGAAFLTPNGEGWRVRLGDGAVQMVKTLDEAAAAIPADQRIHLALPGHVVLLERVTLPSIDREELSGMLQLQLEKTLPFPIEEVSSDFEVISQTESESTLLSVAASAAQLDQLCAPLRSRERLPQKITFYAMHIAASCPTDQIVLCVWPEEAHLEIAICENGKLGFAHTFLTTDTAALLEELPQILLSAEMEGVPAEFSSIRIEHGCAHLQEPLAEYFQKPAELISFDAPLPEPPGNLLPPAWQAEARELARGARLRQRLQAVAVIYLLLVAAAFIFLLWQKRRVDQLDTQLAELAPQLQTVQAQEARWTAFDPAITPQHYAVETLLHLVNSLPSDQLRFTAFDFSPREFTIQGEAPDINAAIGFLEKLQAEPQLSDYAISQPSQPTILPNNAAQFRIFGKL